MLDYTSLEKLVKARLKPSRFLHSLGVVEVSQSLALRFSLDIERARINAIYHDAYKYDVVIPESIEFIENRGIVLFPEEKETPELLHGPLAAVHYREDVGDDVDEAMIDAVRYHTLGSRNMGKEGAILYIADYIEPGRKHLDAGARERILSLSTLEEMVHEIFSMQHRYFLKEGIKEAQSALDMIEYLEEGGQF